MTYIVMPATANSFLLLFEVESLGSYNRGGHIST